MGGGQKVPTTAKAKNTLIPKMKTGKQQRGGLGTGERTQDPFIECKVKILTCNSITGLGCVCVCMCKLLLPCLWQGLPVTAVCEWGYD